MSVRSRRSLDAWRAGAACPARRGLIVLLIALGCPPLPAARASASPVPGPSGAEVCAKSRVQAAGSWAEDRTAPTPNQLLWDAKRYDLDLSFEPDSSWVGGSAQIRLVVRADSDDSLRSVDLDLSDSMRVRFAQANGVFLSSGQIQHASDLLTLQLPTPAAPGASVTLLIFYQGQSRSGPTDRLHFARPGNRPIIYSFGGPRGARRWWPCKDHPEDKADTVQIRAEVPAGLELVANGRLQSRTEAGDHTFFVWLETHPIATYLVSVSAYPYSIYEDVYTPAASKDGADMPIVFYNYPESRADWEPVQAKVKSMLGLFAGLFGEYPFVDEKYGHAQIPFSGGMEHQTITCLGSKDELVVAHELAHQWWGDEITCADYHDVWLNEGFATYCEALYLEATSGEAAYFERMKAAQYFGPGSIYVDDVSDPDRVYDLRLSYSKGAWVLHMLRHVVGSESFGQILRNYRERQRDQGAGIARTSDLAAVASEIAGRDLRPFFDAWIRGQGFPIYQYDWTAEPAAGMWEVRLRIRQMQDEQLFPMPIDLELHSAADHVVATATVWNTTADTTYVLTTPEEPETVVLDPQGWILRRVLPPMGTLQATRPLLLVNGVPWTGDNGARTWQQYQDRVFTAGLDYDFWDYHNGPPSGYPPALPAPVGHGAISAEVMSRYQAVVWVGGNFGGDDAGFRDSPTLSYLEAGGNLLVMCLSGRTFLLDPYREYLGIEWAAGDSSVTSYQPMHSGLPELRLTGEQSAVSLFTVDPGNDKVLLYAEDGNPARALGVVRLPELDKAAFRSGAASEPSSLPGHFVFLSGRPYRWNSDDLRAALKSLISSYLLPPPSPEAKIELRAPWPNPARTATHLAFLLPREMPARLTIYDVTGREVRRLRDELSPAGWNAEFWDGRDDGGRRAPSGVYFGRVEAGGKTVTARVVRIR